jgi:flagellar assembly protein FliH
MIESTIKIGRPLVGVALIDPTQPLPAGSPTRGDLASGPSADRAAQGATQHARMEQERAAIENVVTSLADAAQELEAHRRQLLDEMQQAAVELAVAIASRLVYDKIHASDYPVEALAREAVQRLGAKGPVVVRMHPDDVALLQQRLNGQLLCGGVVELVEDSAVPRGDCAAEAGEVSVLSQMELQLDDIRRHLLRSLGDAQVERRTSAAADRGLRRFPDRRQTA